MLSGHSIDCMSTKSCSQSLAGSDAQHTQLTSCGMQWGADQTSEHFELRRHLPMLLQRLNGLSQQS